MTIRECIDRVDSIKPNQYSNEEKVRWLSFLDGTIINDVLKTHEGYEGQYDDFIEYSVDKQDTPLIVPAPYDIMYEAYIKMKIDEENGETARYNNSMSMFNSYMAEYKKWYNKHHMPISSKGGCGSSSGGSYVSISKEKIIASLGYVPAKEGDFEIVEKNVKESESNAMKAELSAKQSEYSAQMSEVKAKESEDNAMAYELSALNSKQMAQMSEVNAKASEDNAKVSELNASHSEQNAKTSELKAKEYMEQAMATTPEGLDGLISDISVSKSNDALTDQTLGYARKNLVYYPFRDKTMTKNKVTFTDNGDGTITINTTSDGASAFSQFYCASDYVLELEPNTTYKLTGCPSGGYGTNDNNTTYRLRVIVNYGLSSRVNCIDYGDGATFTTPSDYSFIRVIVEIGKGQVANNLTFKPMIRKEEIIDDTFEMYKPSIRKELDVAKSNDALIEQTLGYARKNMFPYPFYETTKIQNGLTFTDNGDGTVSISGTATATSNFFMVARIGSYKTFPKGKYRLSGCPANGSEGTYAIGVNMTNAQGTSVVIGYDTGSGLEFEVTDDTLYYGMQCVIWNGFNANNLVFKPMLQKAEIEDDTWEPYKPSIADEIKDLKKNKYGMLSTINRWFYVDGNSGNDNNDGSDKAPFKTFDRFLEEYSRYSELRCVFKGSCASYDMTSVETFNAIGMHLDNESDVENVTINFYGKSTPAFYNSHLNTGENLEKYITLNIPNNLYFDGGTLYMMGNHVTNGELQSNGAYFHIFDTTFENASLDIQGASAVLTRCVFDGTRDEFFINAINGAILYIRNAITINGTAPCCITGFGSDFKLCCDLTMKNANKVFDISNSTIFSTDSLFNNWNKNSSKFANVSVLGNTYKFLT